MDEETMDQLISNNNEDQRKITPVEIFNKVIFTTKVKATSTNTNTITTNTTTNNVCDMLWPSRDFLTQLKDTIIDEEEKCEFIPKESLIIHYDNISGDRVRELSELHHKYLIFLTYKPVCITMYITFICNFGIRISWGDYAMILSAIMLSIYPPFLSNMLIGKKLGAMHDFSKLATSTFKNNAVSYQFLTGYEIIDSIIAFNLSKISEMPTLYWKAAEERSNLNFMRFFMYFGVFVGIVLIPALFFYFEIYKFLIVWCSKVECGAATLISSFINIISLILLGGNVVEVLVMFLLTLSSHFFQVEVFKTRLELDRTRKSKDKGQGQWKCKRQLIEEYLFHQELLSRSATIWQGILCFSLVYALIVFIATCIIALIIISLGGDTEIAALFLVDGIVAILLFFMLLLLPAQLNSSCGEIVSILTKGADDDWEIYGKRKDLLEYFQSNSLQYTVYKFAITYSWLIGFGSGVTSTLFAIGISFYLGV